MKNKKNTNWWEQAYFTDFVSQKYPKENKPIKHRIDPQIVLDIRGQYNPPKMPVSKLAKNYFYGSANN